MSFEQKLQDIRDRMDQVMIDAIDRVDNARREYPDELSIHAELYDTYSDIRAAKRILDNTNG